MASAHAPASARPLANAQAPTSAAGTGTPTRPTALTVAAARAAAAPRHTSAPSTRLAQADRKNAKASRTAVKGGKAAPVTPAAPAARAVAGRPEPAPATTRTASAADRRPWLEPRATAPAVAAASTRPPPTLPPPLAEPVGLRPGPTPNAAPSASPTPVPAAPTTAPAATPLPPAPEPPRDLQARADTLLASELPRIAERAERRVLRVLFAAGRSEGMPADDEIRQAATQLRLAPAESLSVLSTSEARALDDAAQQAQRRGDLAAAIDLMTRAFAANPLDADIAGDLAALRLRSSSAQAPAARQLALHALTTPHARHPQGRLDDWTTLAIASALTGRERDARNAWYVTLALSPSTERLCRVALNAYVRHGERVRPSIDALLQRAEASGRATGPACVWPPRWAGNSRP
jgi:hypothetical protein